MLSPFIVFPSPFLFFFLPCFRDAEANQVPAAVINNNKNIAKNEGKAEEMARQEKNVLISCEMEAPAPLQLI